MGRADEFLPRPCIRNCLSSSNLYIRQGPSYQVKKMIRRASFCLLRFQKSGFKGIGENKALHALLKADGHISPVQLDHLANAELSVSHSASNGNAGNIDLRFFGLLGLCGSDRRFHAEGSSDKIRLSRWRPSWSGGFGRLRLLVRFRNIGFVNFRRMSQERFRPTLFLLVLKSLASLRIKPVHRSWTKKSAWC